MQRDIDWKEENQDELEQLAEDLAEIADRYKREIENCIIQHLDNAYEIGYLYGTHEQGEV
jgi:hypothetical protein